MISEQRLKFWLANDLNVLFSGRHGVGKSSIIKRVMDEEGLQWKYFSAATMDPWVDFIGIPRTKEEGDTSYLELVRPRDFAQDNVEAIVVDEFNRSHKKVRNAVMELIQFKSINGYRFQNLRVVWAIINPAEDEKFSYDVQPLDPAQKDRFQVHVEIPYRVNRSYFAGKYGAQTAAAAAEWWEGLSDATKLEVSPRRLDYALELHRCGGSLRDALPRQANPRALLEQLDIGSVEVRLETLYEQGTAEEIESFFEVENQYRSAIDQVVVNEEYLERFLPHLSTEKIASLVVDHRRVLRLAVEMEDEVERIADVIDDMLAIGSCAPPAQVELWERRRAKELGERCVARGEEVAIVDVDKCRVMQPDEFGDGQWRESPEEALETMSSRFNSSTRARREALRKVVEDCPVPKGLGDEELRTCLEVVNGFMGRSVAKTVYRFNRRHSLAAFVNALVVEAVERDGLDAALLVEESLEEARGFDHGLVGLCIVGEEACR